MTLPSHGYIGFIRRKNLCYKEKKGQFNCGYKVKHGIKGRVPGKDDIFAAGTEVGTQEELFNQLDEQWDIGKKDSYGYFPIRDTHSGKFLTGFTEDKLTIEGM